MLTGVLSVLGAAVGPETRLAGLGPDQGLAPNPSLTEPKAHGAQAPLTGSILEASALAGALFSDDSQPCLYVCDYKRLAEHQEKGGNKSAVMATECPGYMAAE